MGHRLAPVFPAALGLKFRAMGVKKKVSLTKLVGAFTTVHGGKVPSGQHPPIPGISGVATAMNVDTNTSLDLNVLDMNSLLLPGGKRRRPRGPGTGCPNGTRRIKDTNII